MASNNDLCVTKTVYMISNNDLYDIK